MGSGGGVKKADFSAKPGEMSWNECAAIGAFLKAQQNAKLAREKDAANFAQNTAAFNAAILNSSKQLAIFTGTISNTLPVIISKPINFILNTTIGGTINFIKNVPQALRNFVQFIEQKIADISDKIAAVYGEIKTAKTKKLSEPFKEFKKKMKSLFKIFSPENTDNNDKQIDEAKKAFKLRTFIHDLYKKLQNNNHQEPKKDANK